MRKAHWPAAAGRRFVVIDIAPAAVRKLVEQTLTGKEHPAEDYQYDEWALPSRRSRARFPGLVVAGCRLQCSDFARRAAHLLSDAAQVAPDVLCFLLHVGIERISVVFGLLRLHLSSHKKAQNDLR